LPSMGNEKLLLDVVQRLASERPWATVVSISGAVRALTYDDLENASNRLAWILSEKSTEKDIMYIGPNDVRFVIWVMAAARTGKCVGDI
jgi:acyl-coenzyme A synthetase/AMP-(fatty) acid ligase